MKNFLEERCVICNHKRRDHIIGGGRCNHKDRKLTYDCMCLRFEKPTNLKRNKI